MYRRKSQTWVIHKPIGRSTRAQKYLIAGEDVPEIGNASKLQYMTVDLYRLHIECSGFTSINQKREATELYSMKDNYRKWLFAEVKTSQSIQNLVKDLEEGKAIGVSDGSFKQDSSLGTAAWRIEDSRAEEYIQGRCIVPGAKHLQSAYWSELVGQLALLQFLSEICDDYKINQGQIRVACDGMNSRCG